jgi:hypothetical protein
MRVKALGSLCIAVSVLVAACDRAVPRRADTDQQRVRRGILAFLGTVGVAGIPTESIVRCEAMEISPNQDYTRKCYFALLSLNREQLMQIVSTNAFERLPALPPKVGGFRKPPSWWQAKEPAEAYEKSHSWRRVIIIWWDNHVYLYCS